MKRYVNGHWVHGPLTLEVKRVPAAPHDFKEDTTICTIMGQAEREEGSRYPFVLDVGTHTDAAFARKWAEQQLARLQTEWEQGVPS